MNTFLCYVLGAICGYFFVRGVISPKEFYRFPFLFCSSVLIFIAPSAYTALQDLQTHPDVNYKLAMQNALLCTILGLIGYFTAKPNIKPGLTPHYDLEKLFKLNLVVLAIGAVGYIFLYSMGQIQDWRGLPVYVVYVARFIRPGVLIAISVCLLRPSFWKWSILAFSLIFPLINAVVLLRRSEVFFFGILLIFPFYFIRKQVVPRAFIVAAIVLSFLVITLFPLYRGTDKNVDASAGVAEFLNGEHSNEFLESAITMDAVRRSGDYDHGIIFFNQFVQQFIPRGILGESFKASLFLKGTDLADVRDEYGVGDFKFYLAPTGFAQAFFEFGYFACLFFFVFGHFCKWLELRATKSGDLRQILIYCFFAIFIPFSVSTTISEIPTIFLPSLLIIIFLTYLARIPYQIPRRRRYPKQLDEKSINADDPLIKRQLI